MPTIFEQFMQGRQLAQQQALQQMINDYSDNRYCGINYCFGEHGTYEIRILPGISNPETAKFILTCIFDYVNGYVKNNRFRKKFKFRR